MPIPETIPLTAHGELITINVRHSNRARSISIRVSSNSAELVLPIGGSTKKAHAFLLSREHWIRAKLFTARITQIPDTHIPIYGDMHEIILSDRKALSVADSKILIPKHLSPKIVLTTFLKEVAKNDLKKCATSLSKRLGVTHGKISIKDTKSQWGSCSADGHLSFSWRLVFAPKFVMEYLVAHELSHIIERNHGPKFWKLVKTICPNYPSSTKWLKQNGTRLHQYLA